MSLRSSHLMTLTMSVTWVSRFMVLFNRCDRSPSPVRVGENTFWPFFSRRSDTRRQYQPPTKVPWTNTNVFRAGWAVPTLSFAAAIAARPAAPPIMPRRVTFFSVIKCGLPDRSRGLTGLLRLRRRCRRAPVAGEKYADEHQHHCQDYIDR